MDNTGADALLREFAVTPEQTPMGLLASGDVLRNPDDDVLAALSFEVADANGESADLLVSVLNQPVWRLYWNGLWRQQSR